MDAVTSANRHLIGVEESVLVVIDVQERLLPVVADHEGVVHNIARLLQFAKETGLPVVVAQQEKLGEIVPGIRELVGEQTVVGKRQFDCLACADFSTQLCALGRRSLVLCGIETHICVAQTALHAIDDDYHVQVISDATSSRKRSNWEVGIGRMREAGVVVSSTEMLIYEVLKEAGTELFKRILPIIKEGIDGSA